MRLRCEEMGLIRSGNTRLAPEDDDLPDAWGKGRSTTILHAGAPTLRERALVCTFSRRNARAAEKSALDCSLFGSSGRQRGDGAATRLQPTGRRAPDLRICETLARIGTTTARRARSRGGLPPKKVQTRRVFLPKGPPKPKKVQTRAFFPGAKPTPRTKSCHQRSAYYRKPQRRRPHVAFSRACSLHSVTTVGNGEKIGIPVSRTLKKFPHH